MDHAIQLSWRQIPRSVVALGFVSLFMDISSELIHGLLPLFLVGTLGASAVTLGMIEGIAEATAAFGKLFSGVVSDWVGKRKLLVVIGYSLSAATKLVFPLAGSVAAVLAARFLDRVGKGVRDAPRDALIADLTPPRIQGASYGVRQSLDTIGAIGGPILAIILMERYSNDFHAVFWWAVLPAAISVAVLVYGVQEPTIAKSQERSGRPFRLGDLASLGGAYWRAVAIGVVFTLARFSEAFLLLKGQQSGLPLALAPSVMIVMSFVYAALSAPAGVLADQIGSRSILVVGLSCLVAADLALALAPGLTGLFAGVALWGAFMGLSQGLLPKLVADAAPVTLRGAAFGFFNLVTGIALLAASTLAGLLWERFGSSATFLVGAAFAGVAACAFLVGGNRKVA